MLRHSKARAGVPQRSDLPVSAPIGVRRELLSGAREVASVGDVVRERVDDRRFGLGADRPPTSRANAALA